MDELVARATLFMSVHGAWAGPIVGLLSFGESLAIIGLFIPATAVMLAVGGLVGTGVLDPISIILWAVAGAILGDWISFWFGQSIGPSVYQRWPLKGQRPMVARTRLFFRKYGFAAIFLGRFLGPIRATVPLVAGVMDMPRKPFQIANIASAVLWVPLMFLPGILAARTLGPDIRISEAHILLFGIGILLFTLVAGFITSRVLGSDRARQRRRQKSQRR